MKIVNYKDLGSIEPKSNKMVWCTCGEKKQKLYLERVCAWTHQCKKFSSQVDLYVFNDGKIIEDLSQFKEFENVTFIEFDSALKRQTCWIFPGWKRSFKAAMSLSAKYEKCIHIENDCYITDFKKFDEMSEKSDFTATAFNDEYNFIESTAMILNDKIIRSLIAERYKEEKSYYENVNFEKELGDLFGKRLFIFGKSLRLEEGKTPNFSFSVISQCSPKFIIDNCLAK